LFSTSKNGDDEVNDEDEDDGEGAPVKKHALEREREKGS